MDQLLGRTRKAGLFRQFAQGGICRLLACIDEATRQFPYAPRDRVPISIEQQDEVLPDRDDGHARQAICTVTVGRDYQKVEYLQGPCGDVICEDGEPGVLKGNATVV
ncbi:MAG TPA: hypothetical protein VMS37_04285 [Verrucomicrobiae bacterium]|nr:hypothetical protein [Verrucomicrobiae bacterium]